MKTSACLRLLALAFLLGVGASGARGEKPSPLPEPMQRFLAGRFEPVRSLREIDPAVLAQVNVEGMAEPGAPFSAGCTPRKGESLCRLVLAGRAGGMPFVEYEYGGRAHGFKLVVFQLRDGRPTPVFKAWGGPHERSWAGLQAALKTGRLTQSES